MKCSFLKLCLRKCTFLYHLNIDSVAVILTATGGTAVSGSAGNDTLLSIENVIGSNYDDDITGNDGANRINGGQGNDTLRGGAGSDTYVFEADWGQDIIVETDVLGSDTLDFSALSDALTFTIQESGLAVLSGLNTVIVAGTFVENLVGGTGNDAFIFEDKGVLNGTLDGREGINSIDLSASSTAVGVSLSGASTYLGFNCLIDTVLPNGFKNISTIIGSAISSVDTIRGANRASQWTIGELGMAYSLDGMSIAFNGFEIAQGGMAADTFTIFGTVGPIDLLGGAGDDTFVFLDEAELLGNLDGQSGKNTLDYSAYLTPRNFHLTGVGTFSGFNGTEASIIGGEFMNIGNILGGAETDSLSGLDAVATWRITGSGSYTAEGATLNHDGIDTYIGGALADTFIFYDGVSVPGNIDGRGGSDVLDLSKYTTDVYINLTSGVASIVAGGLTSVENVIGGSGKANSLSGGAGNDQLFGLGGDDYLYGGGGADYLSGGDGTDTAYMPQLLSDILDSIEILLYKKACGTAQTGVVVSGTSYQQPVVIRAQEGISYDLITQESTIMALYTNGLSNVWDADFMMLPSGYAGSVQFNLLSQANLPGALPDNYSYVRGLHLVSNDAAGGGSVFVNFLISGELANKNLAIMVWDADLNDGQGGWVEISATLICCHDGITYNGDMVRFDIQSITNAGDGWVTVVVQVNCYKTGQPVTLYEFSMKVREDTLSNGLKEERERPMLIPTTGEQNTFDIYNTATTALLNQLLSSDSSSENTSRMAIETDQPDYVVLVEKK